VLFDQAAYNSLLVLTSTNLPAALASSAEQEQGEANGGEIAVLFDKANSLLVVMSTKH